MSKAVFRDARALKRQHINEISERLTDQEIFESAETQNYANALAKSMIGDTTLEVKVVYNPMISDLAYTTKDFIFVNAGHPVVTTFVSLADRLQIVTGLLLHEIAHCIFMDYDAAKSADDAIGKGSLYGPAPVAKTDEEEKSLKLLEKALTNERFRVVLQTIFHEFLNIIVDKHDENAVCARYGRYEKACIDRMNDARIKYTREPIEKLMALKDKRIISGFEMASTAALELIYFGDLYMNDPDVTSDTDFYKDIMSLRAHYDKAEFADNNDDIFLAVNQSILSLWPYIYEEIKNSTQKNNGQGGSGGSGNVQNGAQSAQAGSGSQGGGNPSTGAGASSGGSQGGSQVGSQGGSQSNSQGSSQNGSQQSEEEAMKELEQALASLSDEDIKSLAQQIADAAKGLGTTTPEKPADDDARKGKQKGKGAAGDEKSAGNAKNGQSENKNPEDGKQAVSGEKTSQTGSRNDSGDAEETRRKAEENANNLLRQIAEHLADSKVENDLNQDLMVLARGTGFNSTHQGYPCKITRCTAEDAAAYDRISRQQRSLLRSMVRQMQMVFKDMTNNNVKPHQVTGNRFRASDAHRLDGLCFTNKKAVSNDPDIAVLVLVDKSGSMSGARIHAARESALLVYDFCAEFKIPCMVCAHSIPRGMDFEIFSDFRYQAKDRYRIAEGLARAKNACNRDGMALQIAAHMLEARPEPVKLLMIISDGQPADSCYSGKAAEKDIQDIVRKASRKGVKTIAFAIGDDKQRISEIYGERYVDISDLSTMPKKLARIVRRYILESVG